MKRLTSLFVISSVLLTLAQAKNPLPVTQFRYAGPYVVQPPLKIDTTDVHGKGYDAKALLDMPVRLDVLRQGQEWSGDALPGSPTGTQYALHQLGFALTNTNYGTVTLRADKAPASCQLYVDGRQSSIGDVTLEPGTHQFVLKYLTDTVGNVRDSLKLCVDTATMRVSLGLPGDADGRYTIQRMMTSAYSYTPQLSPRGDYLLLTDYRRAAHNHYHYYLYELATGRRTQLSGRVTWMPRSNRYYLTREGAEGRELVTVDPATGDEQVLTTRLPEGYFVMAPTEDYLVFTDRIDGPKEQNPNVFEVLNPEDRQPGWRDRSALSVYDLSTGVKRPLTFGHSSYWLSDISQDGRSLLVAKSEHCYRPLGEGEPKERPLRPHDATSLYRIDLQTLAVDTLVHQDGFIGQASFSPNGSQLLVMGSPEAFGRKGCTLPPDVAASMYDYQLFLVDVASREVRPLTRDFNPSVVNGEWSLADGKIYFTANNRDSVSLYRLEPKSGDIHRLDLPEEVVKGFSLSGQSRMLAWNGQSSMNSDRIYTLDIAKLKLDKKAPLLQTSVRKVWDFSAENLRDVQPAECRAWTFRNSIGDEVTCRYYLPVGYTEHADGTLTCNDSIDAPALQSAIPMITYYYGGCSPTERNFESSYPWQCWAALGYAVLVVQPSGAAGFGQAWSARHVNTAGVDPARDIMEAVREFTRTHAYINKEKVGCCGASYGGFMTQYMQTLPDCPFACAISHAGISDHTTYWGYGYWGYSYSEVSMANSYPWSETDLYVKNSPIYNVDKITTPILFLHGTKDVNVPINNSIQMFTALKLLGRETALVCVEGEDHGIADYDKRLAWLKTQLAWFQKYLKDDSSWWDALYPKKTL